MSSCNFTIAWLQICYSLTSGAVFWPPNGYQLFTAVSLHDEPRIIMVDYFRCMNYVLNPNLVYQEVNLLTIGKDAIDTTTTVNKGMIMFSIKI